MIHCPRLCPYKPPRELFADDYDPTREEVAEVFCGERCGNRSEDHKPYLLEREAGRALLERAGPEGLNVWLASPPYDESVNRARRNQALH